MVDGLAAFPFVQFDAASAHPAAQGDARVAEQHRFRIEVDRSPRRCRELAAPSSLRLGREHIAPILSLLRHQYPALEIWLELGLQSAHADTLKRINRGHDYSAYADAVSRAKARNLKICTHLIVGLPGEGKAECLSTLEQVIATGTDGIKLHPLHVVEGSTMAKAWRADRLTTLSQTEYFFLLAAAYLKMGRWP